MILPISSGKASPPDQSPHSSGGVSLINHHSAIYDKSGAIGVPLGHVIFVVLRSITNNTHLSSRQLLRTSLTVFMATYHAGGKLFFFVFKWQVHHMSICTYGACMLQYVHDIQSAACKQLAFQLFASASCLLSMLIAA